MRLFIGLMPDDYVREELARYSASLQSRYTARYVTPDLYHLTLAFLGEREEISLPKIRLLLSRVAAQTMPFTLSLAGMGTFGHAGTAIAYAAVTLPDELQALDECLRSALSEEGEPFDDKPLLPHITLARKAALIADDLPAGPLPLSFQVNSLVLYHSTRVSGILRYLPIFTIPMGLPFQEEHI